MGEKEGKMEIQKFYYLENEKSFFHEIKIIFHSFWRTIICWKNKNLIKIADTSFKYINFSRFFTFWSTDLIFNNKCYDDFNVEFISTSAKIWSDCHGVFYIYLLWNLIGLPLSAWSFLCLFQWYSWIIMLLFQLIWLISTADFYKKGALKTSKNSQENSYARVSFLIKL